MKPLCLLAPLVFTHALTANFAQADSSKSAAVQSQTPWWVNWQAAKWASYIQSPSSRTIAPQSIHGTSGSVATGSKVAQSTVLSATLSNNGSYVTYDFGKMVSGYITVEFGAKTSKNASLGVAFTENVQFIGVESDLSTDMDIVDGTIYAPANPSSTYTFSREFARGSYRYLTLSVNGNSTIEVKSVKTHFTASPKTADSSLRDYTGYFYSDDDLLNRIWYAGVYTVQLSQIAANESRANPPTITQYGWFNNATITGIPTDSEVYVDGAKRDRTPWAGDFGVSVLPKAVAWNGDNLKSLANAIASLYSVQTNGYFPYAGPPIAPRAIANDVFSDTYHLWTIIALADYTALSGNTDLLKSTWNQTVLAMTTSLNKVDPSDMLMSVTYTYDWGRIGQGGKNIAANVLLYRALVLGADLASEFKLSGASFNGSSWSSVAEAVKVGINTHLWDDAAGQYTDNTTTTLHPQDGNVLAVRFNVTKTLAQAAHVSSGVSKNWNQFGSVAPEGRGMVSPFITGSEIDAHFTANPANASRAMEITRRMWGYMMRAFSNSTLIEGYYETGVLDYPFYGPGKGSYISHAHAWSTGPVASLTLQLGGLAPVKDAGEVWAFQPHAAGSGVKNLQTGYTLATGFFSVEWSAKAKSNTFFTASLVVPVGTTGSISVPTFGNAASSIEISINGRIVWKNNKVVHSDVGAASTAVDGYITFASATDKSGSYTIVAKTT